MNLSNASLHYTIIKYIIDFGFAPDAAELAGLLNASEDEIVDALKVLADDHGVVLHPGSSKIWVIHPFSLAPTNFLVHYADKEWWGNCAWCSLGAAALLKRDVTITTTLGANGRRMDVHIRDGRIIEQELLVHFPIAMRNAWDNVVYTCSTMLLFENMADIDAWSSKHRIPKGDVQPITNVWEFAKVWYGEHLNPNWKKWTAQEAKNIFTKFGLTGDIWDIEIAATRF